MHKCIGNVKFGIWLLKFGIQHIKSSLSSYCSPDPFPIKRSPFTSPSPKVAVIAASRPPAALATGIIAPKACCAIILLIDYFELQMF
jgi:hypothetical protein